jgi:hypothetical protein
MTLGRFLDRRASSERRRGCVLTFASAEKWCASSIELLGAHNLFAFYLFGPQEKCIELAVERDRNAGHPTRDRNHWLRYNLEQYSFMSEAQHRVCAFDDTGNHLSCEEIARRIELSL